MDRRLFEVGQVHRDLGQAAHQESSALYESHSTARKAHRLGDFLGDFDVWRVQENVIGNQEFARADDGSPCGRMDAGFANVRTARGIGGDLGADAFELSAANIFQALAFGNSGGGLVEINGDAESLPDLLSHVARHGHAVFNGDAVDRDERDYVGSAHARMRASMDIEVDKFSGPAHAANRGFLNGFALAGEGDNGPVVVGIHLAIQQIDAGHLHGVDDGVNFGFVAAFRKIGNAFDERGHK